MKTLFAALFICIALSACKKSDDTAPVVTITAPTDGQSFTAGQTVHVIATISDNTEIHHVHCRVNNANTDQEILHFEDHIDQPTYNMDQTFTTQAGVTYKIEVEADDHSGNDTKKDISVSSN
jgi:hypothetical protein